MALRSFAGLFGGVSLLLVAPLSHAACSMDNECPGEQVCENKLCVEPSAALPAAPAPPPGASPPTPVLTAPSAPPAPPTPAQGSYVADPQQSVAVERPKPKFKRHDKGMMVGGIIMVSLAPIGLWVAAFASLSCDFGEGKSCQSQTGYVYGGLLGAGILAGVGIPLIIKGAKKEPLAAATVSPWLGPHAGGVQLHVDL